MTTITGYGGLGEIGGNAFLLDDGKNRILLDIGKRFGNDTLCEELGLRPGWGDYWDEFLKPRTYRLIADLEQVGLIPDIPGIYREDLGGHGAPTIDAIFVSHAHMDHAGLLGLCRPQIPILTSKDTVGTLKSVEVTSSSSASFEADLVNTRSRGNLGRKQDGQLTNAPRFAPGPKRNFKTDNKHGVGDWQIEFHRVDHSIHGAVGAIITNKKLSLAYTGDFRLGGRHGHETANFVKKAAGCDYLITEGTRVRRPSDRDKSAPVTDKEVEVEQEIADLVEREDKDPDRSGFVGIAFPPRDLDRFQSVYNVAKRSGRKLAIGTKLAHLLDTMRAEGRTDLPDPRNDSQLAIHIRPKKTGTILAKHNHLLSVAKDDLTVDEVQVTDAEYNDRLLADYSDWERPYVSSKNAICGADVRKNPTGYLLGITYWSITDLFDVFEKPGVSNGLYIHCATQPFNDDMEQNDRKLDRWLRLYKLDRKDTHVSGHLSGTDLDWVLDEVKPRVVIPVHSLATEYTAERFRMRTGRTAILPRYGNPEDLP